MSKIIKLNFLKRPAPSSLLGLAFDGGRLEGVVLKRHNGSLQVGQFFTTTLTLDPLTAEVELVGREILNHLEAAGIRERNCVVALPLKWVLAAHTQIPKIPDADVPEFLQLEMERGFPTDVATLQVATSRFNSASGEEHATFVGIPRNHVDRLESVLRAAKLKPVSFSLGITALQPVKIQDGVLALVIGDNHVGLQVSCGGGLAALRALEGTVEITSGERMLHAELIAREARITLGQLPVDLRDSVKVIRIFGPKDQVQELADEMRRRFEGGGLKVETVSTYPPREFGKTIPPETPVSRSFSLAARQLVGRDDPFEFLPPKISAWQRVTSKYAPGKLRKLAAVAAFVVLLIVGLFAYQQWQLNSLRSEWKGMSAKVTELKAITGNISQYRPWFAETFPCLSILRQLTLAFPENGSLTAKTLEIRDMKTVSCSGSYESISALIHTQEQLGTNFGVGDVVPQTRGNQFTLEYHVNGGPNENR